MACDSFFVPCHWPVPTSSKPPKSRRQASRRRMRLSASSTSLSGAAGLGLPPRLPFEMGFLLSQWMVDEPNLLSAVSVICDDIARDHPALWHGHECRGRVQRKTGDLLGADTAFKEALRLAKQAGDAGGITAADNGLRAIAPK